MRQTSSQAVRPGSPAPTERWRAWLYVGPAILWTAAFFVLPFLAMGWVSLTVHGTGEGPTVANYLHFFLTASYRQAMVNSLEVTLMVTAVSIVLAYPFAWFLAEIVPERWQRLGLMLAVLPFWTSYVVRSYSWLLVLAEHGVLNNAMTGIGLLSDPVHMANTRFATVTGFVHFFVMLLTLTIYANLKQLSASYRKAAADLGANGFQTFVYVILPLTLPGIIVGGFLTFVLAIGDYITPQILGGGRELLMPQLIMLQVGRRGDFPMASALALLLMVVVTAAYFACARWLKIERV